MPLWILLLIVALTLIIQGPLTLSTELLARDDRWLTAPLKEVHNLADWWALIRSGSLPDFQPVRDLSYWIDWQLARALGTEPHFHLSNILIWWAVLALVWQIAQKVFPEGHQKKGFSTAAIVVILMAIHPVAVEPVAWVSGRKHLLSLLFTLIATRLILGHLNPVRALLILTAFAAGALSQPINVLWPIWAITFLATSKNTDWMRQHRPTIVILTAGLALVSLSTIALNMTVYQGVTWFGFQLTPHAEIYGKKLSGFRWDEIDISMLAAGRYFFNLLIPFNIAHRYSTGALANLVGLLMIPLAGWAGFHLHERRKEFWLWSLYAALPILVVTAQLSDIFVADSYALAALPGTMLAAAVMLKELTSAAKGMRWFFAAVCSLALAQSVFIARAWTSAEALWSRSQSVEETPDSLYFTAGDLLNMGEYDEALARAGRLLELSPGREKPIQLFITAVCSHPRMPAEEKRANLARLGIPGVHCK
jgi:hypothetical protein